MMILRAGEMPPHVLRRVRAVMAARRLFHACARVHAGHRAYHLHKVISQLQSNYGSGSIPFYAFMARNYFGLTFTVDSRKIRFRDAKPKSK